MKKAICILFFICALIGNQKLCANEIPEDTCTPKPLHIDIKPQIVNKLFDCFVNSNFYGLAIYCTSSVDFVFQKDSTLLRESVTEYKAMENLTNLFSSASYNRFKIMSGKNIYEEDVFICRVFFSDINDDVYVDVYFVLDKRNAIKTIAIIF